MHSKEDLSRILEGIENLLEDLKNQQNEKSRKRAQELHPRLTREDLLNPDNFPELVRDPHFMYEDGIAAGILASKIAIRTWFKNT